MGKGNSARLHEYGEMDIDYLYQCRGGVGVIGYIIIGENNSRNFSRNLVISWHIEKN